jgi:hypothetical protein
MKKRIIIGAIVIAGVPSVYLAQPTNEPTFFRFIEMNDTGEYKAADNNRWLNTESTLFILAKGYYADYQVERADGEVIGEVKPLWGNRIKTQEGIPTPMNFSPDKFIEACKRLYADLKDVEVSDADFKTIILKSEATPGENLVINYRLTSNESVKFREQFEIWQPGFLKIAEEYRPGKFKEVGEKSWVNLGNTLFLAMRGYNVQYQVLKKNGTLKGEPKTILWDDQLKKPKMYVDEKFSEFCEDTLKIKIYKYEYATIDLKRIADDGETLIITYENAYDPTEAKSKSFKVLRSRWAIVPVQSFSINTVFNYEIGKKKADGGTGSGFSAGPGGNVPVFYYRFPDSKDWDKIGFALNFNVAPTEVLNADTDQTENVYVWTGGGLFIAKFKASPVLLLLGYGYSLNGDDKYGKINFGFGAELTQ